MHKPTRKIIVVLGMLALHACASDRAVPPVSGPFEKADANQDMFISYDEFKNYAAYKASPDPVERAQVKEEAKKGYLAHQKRFLMLDQNNDGKLSYVELGGG